MTKIPKTKRQTYGMNKTLDASVFVDILIGQSATLNQ